MTLICRLLPPLRRLLTVFSNSFAMLVHDTKVELRIDTA
eukprot:CAMPEP_0171630636 /NCGR_PEP_ID=MMETSP0990-20121206/23061_1 /TAXON_ID=483369 /ORGANISM="non described non described, Strain CCMP2098" /LENGTH=38 /DNA_ID= /DNA_START= /DNA_END= /DNA_ORIENTATION=